jgi:anti-sigma regulatory factor (Ser/Thr protein kinase)
MMMKNQMTSVSLKVYLNTNLLRLVTSFAEESAKAFDLNTAEALKLTLACEEIFVYLCRAGRAEETIAIEAANGGYYVQVKFSSKARDFNPRAFNLTSSVSFEDTASLEEMGLLIASRAVERFYITEEPQQGFGLVLIKEKSYPDLTDLKVPEIKPIKNVTIKTPEADTLKLFVRLIATHYPSHLYPQAFLIPGKMVDMVASGEYGAKVGVDVKGQIGGGILWRWVGSKTVESFGPYLFNQPHGLGLSEAFTDACLGEIAKTGAIGLISRYSTPELAKGYFESLGSIDLFQLDGSAMPWPIYYRQLHEDLGCQVWAHPVLEDFLRAEYRRLFFPREIRPTRYAGEQRPSYSVFTPQFDRTNRQITLRAIWDGSDAAENLSQHLKVLKAENLPNIFFEVDLGHAWQANLSQILFDSGFRPRLILPYGGECDVVVFQYQGGQ